MIHGHGIEKEKFNNKYSGALLFCQLNREKTGRKHAHERCFKATQLWLLVSVGENQMYRCNGMHIRNVDFVFLETRFNSIFQFIWCYTIEIFFSFSVKNTDHRETEQKNETSIAQHSSIDVISTPKFKIEKHQQNFIFWDF